MNRAERRRSARHTPASGQAALLARGDQLLAELIGRPDLRGRELADTVDLHLRFVAEAATSPQQARRLLERACRTDDRALGWAVAQHASDLGWPGIATAWAVAWPHLVAVLAEARAIGDELTGSRGA